MTSASLIIRNAQVLLPSGEIALREVAVSDGKITAVGTGLSVSSNINVVDGSGLTLLPGAVDPQVHFRDSELDRTEHLFTETCACAKGGVTSFLGVPNTSLLAIAASKSLVNYGCFIGATADSLPDLREANPTCGIQISMESAHENLTVDTAETVEPIFAKGDRLIAAGANNQDNQTALASIKLALSLSKKHQRRLHVLQVSSGEMADMLRRDKPSWVTAEVTPQHLLLDAIADEKIGTPAPMNPPLRSERDREILWQALLDGVIDFIATSHTPYTIEKTGKARANHLAEMPGVETALPLMLTQAKENRCTIAQVSNWMSTAIAQAYQIPNKGLIEPGYDADLVLVDLSTYRPVLREELKTQGGWSPFEGWTLTGWPVVTIVGGQVAYDRGAIDTSVRGQALQFV